MEQGNGFILGPVARAMLICAQSSSGLSESGFGEYYVARSTVRRFLNLGKYSVHGKESPIMHVVVMGLFRRRAVK